MKRELPIMERKISNVQPFLILTINMLSKKALAVPLANNQTLIDLLVKDRLRSKRIIYAFTNEMPLYFKCLSYGRLHHRLQIHQLSNLPSLQDLVVFFAKSTNKKMKTKRIENSEKKKINAKDNKQKDKS